MKVRVKIKVKVLMQKHGNGTESESFGALRILAIKVKVKPGHEEVLVCGNDVVGKPLLLQVGEQGARTSVAQQVTQVPALRKGE